MTAAAAIGAADAAVRPARIDAERLIQWALERGRSGGLPWRDEAALSLNEGLTVRFKRKPRGSWALCYAVAGAATRPVKRTVVLSAIGDDDAALVLAAVKALPGAAAALVLRHGRNKTRPAWRDPVETLRPALRPDGSPVIAYQCPRLRKFYPWPRHAEAQPYCALAVETRLSATPAAIARWQCWRDAVRLVAERLAGRLARWEIAGFAAPAAPWLGAAAPAPPAVTAPSRWPVAVTLATGRRFAVLADEADAAE